MAARERRAPALRRATLAGATPPVVQHHAAAQWHLLWPEAAGAADRAVDELSRAVDLAPDDAGTRNDLAAAYYLRALERDEPLDLVRALAAAEEAALAAPPLPEALFNRALLRQELGLRGEAELAWRAYLELPDAEPWRQEAAERLAALSRPTEADRWRRDRPLLEDALRRQDEETLRALASRYPQELRLDGEARLGAWGHGDEGALDAARAIGGALVGVGGDPLVADAVATIDAADAAGRETLASGHRLYADGVAALSAGRHAEAAEPLRTARSKLATAGSPWEGWAVLQQMVAAYGTGRAAEVEALAGPVLGDAKANRYRALRARVLSMLATTETFFGWHTSAIADYREASAIYNALGERGSEAAVETRLASPLELVGRLSEAWHHLCRTFELLADLEENRTLRLTLSDAAYQADEMGADAAALPFLGELMRAAEVSGSLQARVSALRHRGTLLGRLGETGAALADLDTALALLPAFSDETTRRSNEAHLRLERARLLRASDPAGAERELETVLASYRALHYELLVPEVLAERAAARREAGDPTAAEEDLGAAIEVLESQRGSLASGTDRIGFLDRARSVYEQRVLLALERGDATAALGYAERARARLLLDELHEPGVAGSGGELRLRAFTDPPPIGEVLARLPRDLTAVVYFFTADELLAWVVSSGAVDVVRIPVDRRRVEREVNRLRDWAQGAPVGGDAAANLFDQLLRPLLPHVPNEGTLLLVPDGPLFSLPFALLFDRDTDRYAVERWATRVTPSLSVAAVLVARRRPAPAVPPRALLVAASEPDRRLFPGAEQLPRAKLQAAALDAVYGPSSVVLSGSEATPFRLRRELGSCDVLHFAGHAVDNPKAPLTSELVLAQDGDEPGAVQAADLLREGAGPALAVLAACRTAGATAPSSEPLLGLPWAFLAGGTAEVLATLWPIADDEVEPMEQLHRVYLATGDAAVALRQVQLGLIDRFRRGEIDRLDLAAFTAYGLPLQTIDGPRRGGEKWEPRRSSSTD